jgi:hypothetical protein
MVFSVVFVQAETVQPQENMHQLAYETAQTDDDIFAFAKSRFEEEFSKFDVCSDLLLPLPVNSFKSDDMIEMVGKYLSTKTDAELRTRIQNDCAGEGKVLLGDFFDTVVYKELRKKLEKCIYVMTSCNFLTPEESKILRESKVFYPDNYKASAFRWSPRYDRHKIREIYGELSAPIGLKENGNIHKESFGVVISVEYRCSLRQIERRDGVLSENVQYYMNTYVEPQHNMNLLITFVRDKDTKFNIVSFEFNVIGCERAVPTPEAMANSRFGTFFEELVVSVDEPIFLNDIQYMSFSPSISGECTISSLCASAMPSEMFPDYSDFIIKSDKKRFTK